MCDVERPMNSFGRLFNLLYRFLIKGTLVPNTTEDKSGVFSTLFAAIAPLRQSTLKLRNERRHLYNVLKLTLNTSLMAMLFVILFAFFSLFESFLSARLWL